MGGVENIGFRGVFETPEFQRGLEIYTRGMAKAAQLTDRAAKQIAQAGQGLGLMDKQLATAGAAFAAGGMQFGQGAADVARRSNEMGDNVQAASDKMGFLGGAARGALGQLGQFGTLATAATGGAAALGGALGSLAVQGFQRLASSIQEAIRATIEWGAASVRVAGEVDQLQRTALFMGQRAGEARDEILSMFDTLEDQGIRADAAARLVGSLGRNFIDLGMANDIAALAQNQGKIAMIDSSDALDRLNTAALTSNVLMARRVELFVDFVRGQDEFAAATGRTRDQLSGNEIVLANYNELLRAGQGVSGTYAVAQGSAVASLKSLERQIFNVQASIGAPFQAAWFELVSLARRAVDVFAELVGEGGALEPILIQAGAAAALLAEIIGDLGDIALRAVSEFAGNFGEGMGGVADDALSWGIEITAALAEGLIGGAAVLITNAMNFISSLLTFWLAPGSPPRVAPNIDVWGADTMTEYLRGFTQADFGVLRKLQGPLKQVLDTDVFAAVSQDIARALEEGVDPGFFDRIAQAAGRFGDEIAELARRQFELADATEAVEKANEQFANSQRQVDSLVDEHNRLLREGADQEALDTSLAAINAAQDERDAALEQAAATEERVEALKDQAALQEQIVDQLLLLSKQQQEAARAGRGGGGGGGGAAAARAGIAGLALPTPFTGDFDLATRIGEAVDLAKEELRQRLFGADGLFMPLISAWEDVVANIATLGLGDAITNALRAIGLTILKINGLFAGFVADFLGGVGTIIEAMIAIGDALGLPTDDLVAFNQGVLEPLERRYEGIRIATDAVIKKSKALGENVPTKEVSQFEQFVSDTGQAFDNMASSIGDSDKAMGELSKNLPEQLLKNFTDNAVNPLASGLGAVGQNAKDARDSVKNLSEAIGKFNSKQMDPFIAESPAPLALGLRQINQEMQRMSTFAMPRFEEFVQTPVIAQTVTTPTRGGGGGVTGPLVVIEGDLNIAGTADETAFLEHTTQAIETALRNQ